MQQIKISVAWEYLYFRWPMKIFCIAIALSYALWYVFKWKIYLLSDIKINWVFCVLSANPRHGPGSLVTKRQPWPQEAQKQLHNAPGLKVGQKDQSSWSAAVALPSREEITERTTPSAGRFCVWAWPPPRKRGFTPLMDIYQSSSWRAQSGNLRTTKKTTWGPKRQNCVYGQTSSWIDLSFVKNMWINESPNEGCQESLPRKRASIRKCLLLFFKNRVKGCLDGSVR